MKGFDFSRGPLAWTLKVFVGLWGLRAILFFVSSEYRPHLSDVDRLLERVLWAVLDGLLALPQTITWILSGVMWLAAQILPPLQQTFGFDMSEVSAQPVQMGGNIPFAQPIEIALTVVVVAIITQFLTLFGILATNKAVVWVAPARPNLEGRKTLLFGVVPLSVGLVVAVAFFPSNPMGAVLGGVLTGIVVRFPYLGALPLWLGFLIGLRPHQFVGFAERLFTSFRSQQTGGNNGGHRQGSRSHDGYQKSEGQGGGSQQEQASSREPPQTGKAAYQDALSVLGLADGEFDRTALRRRFTELATRLHADHGGSDGLMRSLNHAYDVALAHNGWRR